jgi:hypothetical protein
MFIGLTPEPAAAAAASLVSDRSTFRTVRIGETSTTATAVEGQSDDVGINCRDRQVGADVVISKLLSLLLMIIVLLLLLIKKPLLLLMLLSLMILLLIMMVPLLVWLLLLTLQLLLLMKVLLQGPMLLNFLRQKLTSVL